jgi:hypothetical protein
MKNTKWMLPVSLILLTGLLAAQLGTSSTVKAEVPFDFMANNMVIPAGECVIGASEASNPVLTIRNADAKKSAMAVSSRNHAGKPADKSVLVFKRYGSRYFLSSVRVEGSNISYHLPTNKAESELRAQNAPVSEINLLASLN